MFNEFISWYLVYRIHLELLRCINKPIQAQCGVEAARLIYGIAKAQVPIQISRNCKGDEFTWPEPSKVRGHQASPLLVTWLTVWTSLWVFCKMS